MIMMATELSECGTDASGKSDVCRVEDRLYQRACFQFLLYMVSLFYSSALSFYCCSSLTQTCPLLLPLLQQLPLLSI